VTCPWCREEITLRVNGTWVHTSTNTSVCDGKPRHSSDTDVHTCAVHPDAKLIYERGGDDMPTIHGRWYCPECQRMLNEALDAQEKKNV